MDFSKTLQELDGQDWGEPTFPSSLVIDCHRLRRVPLKDFTDGDLRRVISQSIGLEYLVPVALNRLSNEPLAGDWYDGDLLLSVLNVPRIFWLEHIQLQAQLRAALQKALHLLSDPACNFAVNESEIKTLVDYVHELNLTQ